MSFQIRVEPAAEKKLARLDLRTQRRLAVLLRQLPGAPLGQEMGRPLKGANRLRSLRVAGCRVIYMASEEDHAVHILAVSRGGR